MKSRWFLLIIACCLGLILHSCSLNFYRGIPCPSSKNKAKLHKMQPAPGTDFKLR